MRAPHFSRLVAAALGATVLAVALPAAASAQLPGLDVGIGGGVGFPGQTFNDEADRGYNLQGSIWLRLPVLPVGVRGDVSWQTFPDELDGDFRHLGAFANATAELPSLVIHPYGLAGIGFVRHTVPDVDHGAHLHAGDGDSDFSFQIGGGVRLSLLGLGAFAEIRYMDMGEDYAAVPLTVGVVF